MKPFGPNELAQALFQQCADALFLFDPQTERVLEVNATALKLTGFTREQLQLLEAHQLFHLVGKGDGHPGPAAVTKYGIRPSPDGYYLRTHSPTVWIPVLLTIAQLPVQPQPLGLITARDISSRRELQTQLNRKESELNHLRATISDCFWTASIRKNGSWVFRSFSANVQQIMGYPPKYFLEGLSQWWQIVYPEDRPRCEQAINKLRAGMPSQAVYRVIWPDGSIHWVRDQVQVSLAGDGQSLWLEGRLTDITERKRAEEHARLQTAVLQTLAEGVFLVDCCRPGWTILFINPALERLTGLSSRWLLGRNWRLILSGTGEPDLFEPAEEALRRQQVFTGEVPCTTYDGSQIWLAVSLSPIRESSGKLTHYVGVLRNITERKHLERQLTQLAPQVANLPVSAGAVPPSRTDKRTHWDKVMTPTS